MLWIKTNMARIFFISLIVLGWPMLWLLWILLLKCELTKTSLIFTFLCTEYMLGGWIFYSKLDLVSLSVQHLNHFSIYGGSYSEVSLERSSSRDSAVFTNFSLKAYFDPNRAACPISQRSVTGTSLHYMFSLSLESLRRNPLSIA